MQQALAHASGMFTAPLVGDVDDTADKTRYIAVGVESRFDTQLQRVDLTIELDVMAPAVTAAGRQDALLLRDSHLGCFRRQKIFFFRADDCIRLPCREPSC